MGASAAMPAAYARRCSWSTADRRDGRSEDELLDLASSHAEALRRPFRLITTRAQLHVEPEPPGRAADGVLIQHPVRGALQAIRRPHGRNALGKPGKRRLANREGDDRGCRRQFCDEAMQGAGRAGRDRASYPRDERVGVVLAHGQGLVFVGLCWQPRSDQRHAPARDDRGHAVQCADANQVGPPGMVGDADDTRGTSHEVKECARCWGSVVSGRWSVVGGRWSVVGGGGRWSVVGGRWSVVGGRWSPRADAPFQVDFPTVLRKRRA